MYGAYCHYDDVIDNGKDDCDYIIEKHNGKNSPFIKVIFETVTMWTSLCDKNGAKIFEGDIVGRVLKDFPFYNYIVYFVEFRFGKFILEAIKAINKRSITPHEELPISHHYECEIIGNIYENPDSHGISVQFYDS